MDAMMIFLNSELFGLLAYLCSFVITRYITPRVNSSCDNSGDKGICTWQHFMRLSLIITLFLDTTDQIKLGDSYIFCNMWSAMAGDYPEWNSYPTSEKIRVRSGSLKMSITGGDRDMKQIVPDLPEDVGPEELSSEDDYNERRWL